MEKRREDELEHNNTADSKELILHQASMEAMYWSADERVCVCVWKGSAAKKEGVCYFYDLGQICENNQLTPKARSGYYNL